MRLDRCGQYLAKLSSGNNGAVFDEFGGRASIGLLVAGTVSAGLGKAVVSPTGLVRFTPLPEQLGTTVFEGVVWTRAA